MAINITVGSIISGTPPYNVWVCDSCGVGGNSQYIDTFSTSAYTFTLPTIYESYTTYYVKVIDANGCSYCVSPDLIGCDIFVAYWDGYDYYKYNLVSDTYDGPLSLPITTGSNGQIANTDDKMWFLSSTGVTELDITINPFTSAYGREIAINLDNNKEIFAIDNDNLVVVASNTGTSTTYVYDVVITGSTGNTTNLFEVVGSLSGDYFTRDVKVSTEGKVIIIGDNALGNTFLQQYDYVSGGTLEVEINLSGITNVGSFVESNDEFFILNNSNEVYQINLTAPYLITFEKTSTTPIGFGRTSQRYGCITQKFT